ncbi:NtaA/DmoA family FMN-dependent monooxygenase [Microbacterium sp. GXF7504]
MKKLILGAFQSFSTHSMGSSIWAHPESAASEYTTLAYWQSMTKALEEGGFDFLFLAGDYGYPGVDGRLPESAFEVGAFLGGDPVAAVATMIGMTEHLGLVATAPTTFDHPLSMAHRFTTLDHLSDGRIGWNVVTSAGAATASELFGMDLIPHDARYDMADEFLDLAFDLWERGWEDGSIIKSKADRLYAEPTGIRFHDFEGKYFRSRGVYTAEPSRQRTPVIFQAGMSTRGREFAARNAECVFLQGSSVSAVRDAVAEIKRFATEFGRDVSEIKTIVGMTVITAPTDAEAEAKHRDYLDYTSDGAAAMDFARLTGVNLLAYDPALPLPEGTATEQGQSNLERYTRAPDGRARTVREIIDEWKARSTRGNVFVGAPATVAAMIEDYVRSTDVDGFLVEPYITPGTYDEFIKLVMPELDARGMIRHVESATSLRDRIFGEGDRIADSHRARTEVRS